MTSSIPSPPANFIQVYPLFTASTAIQSFCRTVVRIPVQRKSKKIKNKRLQISFFVFNFEDARLQNVSILQSTTCTNHLQAVFTRKNACRRQDFRTKQQMIIPDGISSCHTGSRKPSSAGYRNALTPEILSPENFSI